MVPNKKRKVLSCLLLLILISNVLVGCTKYKTSKSYDMYYEITAISSKEDILKVTLRIENPSLYKNNIEFYTGDKLISLSYCKDDKGQDMPFINREGVLSIPAQDKSSIEVSYEVKIGIIGKHGYRGKIYDDLVVFDGGQVLLFPIEFYTESDDMSINSISITCNVPEEWEEVTPFKKIVSPSWQQLYAIYNSCFAYGDMHKKEYKKGKTSFCVFTDSKGLNITDETEKGLNALFDYYSALFGYELKDYSIVLVRPNPQDMLYIIGGAGGRSVGSTFNPSNPRDWQLLSHRMFHAFFESKVESNIFLKPPQLWLYEGLATYYENTSMESLPEGLKDRLVLNSQDLFNTLYKKYIYMRIKYHPLLSLSPMNEERIAKSPAKTEFLHYTQAPLVIKAMEDLSHDKRPNKILNYILRNESMDEKLYIENIVSEVLIDEYKESFYHKYILSDEILPLWHLGNEENHENVNHIIDELNYMEYVIWSWFRLEYGDYPPYVLNAQTINRLSEITNIHKVHFAKREIEENVRTLSPVVYYGLKEFFLRADICDINSENPIIATKDILNEQNVNKWENWLSER